MIVTRLMLLLQLITVFPLITYIFRSQFFMIVLKKEVVGYKKIFLLNSVVLFIAICFAIFLPTIGNIIRYVGGLCGAVVVFILPSLTYLVSTKKDGKLSFFNVVLHCTIISLGVANFVAQFFV
jgi:sodium-coupled neutral amino acid transporter 9